MSDPSATRHATLREIPDWDEVARVGGYYSSAHWLRMFDFMKPTYLAIRDGSRTTAVACCQTATEKGAFPPFSDVSVQYLPGDAPPVAAYPLTTCGPPRGYTARLLLRPDLDPPARTRSLRRLVDEIFAIGRETRSPIVAFTHLPPQDAAELRRCEDSFLPLYANGDAAMAVPADFDAYLQSLKSKNREHSGRKRAELDIRHFTEDGYRFEWKPLRELLGDAVPLMVEHEAKFQSHFDPKWLTDFWTRFSEGVDVRAIAARDPQGKVVGALFVVVHDGVFYVRAEGHDSKAPPRIGLYFNLTYYEPMRGAIAAGARSVHVGSLSLEAKVRRGCRVQPLWHLVRREGGWPAEVRQAMQAESRRRFEADEKVLLANGDGDLAAHPGWLEGAALLGAV